MKPVEIARDIYWVGAIDWNVRDFHGYSTGRGSTYNAFLIMDEKITLVDTVKAPFADELMERIACVVDPKRIDCVVSNHTEMDHSGSLPRVLHYIGEDKPVYCSRMGKKNLAAHFGDRFNLQAVENGGSLSLGKRSLSFVETRMIHWPDSMFSYCPEERILFSSDGFGQHYASNERFDDQADMNQVMTEAEKYYANILLLYSDLIAKLLANVGEMNLALDMICPDHGILWRKDPGRIVNAYAQWTQQKPGDSAVVVFDTMWHSTEKMARAIVDGLGEAGVRARLMNLRTDHRSDVMTAVMGAGAVLVGSPTLNNGLFPTVADFLAYMKGLKPRNKIGAAFGSYGWSGESVKLVHGALAGMGFAMEEPGVKAQYVPGDDALKACRDLGLSVGRKVREAAAVANSGS
ncbi:MAG: flavodoxin domain-containing protein [Pseudomonadota bacterium]